MRRMLPWMIYLLVGMVFAILAERISPASLRVEVQHEEGPTGPVGLLKIHVEAGESVEFAPGQMIADDRGRPWLLADSLRLRADIRSIRVEHVLVPAVDVPEVASHYVSHSVTLGEPACTPEQLCCARLPSELGQVWDRYSLETNRTAGLARVYRPFGADVTVRHAAEWQSGRGGARRVSWLGTEASGAGWTASAIVRSPAGIDALRDTAAFHGFYAVEPPPPSEGPFLVPQARFGDLPGHIGLSAAGWRAAVRCLDVDSTQRVLQVDGGPSWDALAVYRGHLLAAMHGGLCQRRKENSARCVFECGVHLAAESSKMTLRLGYEAGVELLPRFGVATLHSARAIPLAPSSRQLILDVSLFNAGAVDAALTAGILRCCAAPSAECTSAVAVGPVRSVFVPSKQVGALLLGAQWLGGDIPQSYRCLLAVGSEGSDVREIPVLFQSTPSSSSSAMQRSTTASSSGCTEDETWSDSRSQCVGVDCVLAYGGQRNWFNAVTRRCEAVVKCSNASQWDPSSNSCLAVPGPVPAGNCSSSHCVPNFVSNASLPLVPPWAGLNCGPHGTRDASNVTCVCDSGYYTNPLQLSAANFSWCDQTAPPHEEGGFEDSPLPGFDVASSAGLLGAVLLGLCVGAAALCAALVLLVLCVLGLPVVALLLFGSLRFGVRRGGGFLSRAQSYWSRRPMDRSFSRAAPDDMAWPSSEETTFELQPLPSLQPLSPDESPLAEPMSPFYRGNPLHPTFSSIHSLNISSHAEDD